MSKILVSGLINLETTLQVDGFPIQYSPVNFPFHGIASTVSGVGFNISKALLTLGDEIRFLSLIGDDHVGLLVRQELASECIPATDVLSTDSETAQSVILYEPGGRGQIYVDLKDVQKLRYPAERFREALRKCDLAVLCNINFSRPLLEIAGQAGVRIATDVHTISDLNDPHIIRIIWLQQISCS